jgi:hypothetical protein
MNLSKVHKTPLQVENGGVCCMIGKSKGARKESMHAGLQHSTAQYSQSTTYQHTRQTWMALNER